MSDRELVLNAILLMPEQASLVEILEELKLAAAVREGLDQSDRGEGAPIEKVREFVRQWTTE